jgi:plastocyanin
MSFMKRKLFSLLLSVSALTGLQSTAFATIHTVQVSNDVFTPATLSIPLGDTVQWVWVSGFHSTTSTSIPSGAASWDQDITSSLTSYIYIPTVTGVYDYECKYHASMGMVASFTVTPPLGIKNLSEIAASISPNPAKDVIRISAKEKISSAQLFDISGKLVRTLQPVNATSSEQTYSVKSIASGTYFLQIHAGDKVEVQKLVIQ